MSYEMSYLSEEQQEARENALHDFQNHIWQQDQKHPINLVKDLIDWMDEDKESRFDKLETWTTDTVDSLVENLENLGIWVAENVNPYSSSSWIEILNPLIESGRIARICSFLCSAKKDNRWKNVIDQFTKARAELELQQFEIACEPYYE